MSRASSRLHDDAEHLLTCTVAFPMQVQKSWMYLEPIFGAQDIQKQLPAEYKAFDQVHRQLREIMRRTKDRPNALQVTSNAGPCILLRLACLLFANRLSPSADEGRVD